MAEDVQTHTIGVSYSAFGVEGSPIRGPLGDVLISLCFYGACSDFVSIASLIFIHRCDYYCYCFFVKAIAIMNGATAKVGNSRSLSISRSFSAAAIQKSEARWI